MRSLKKNVLAALFGAIAFLVMFLGFPILPGAAFLKYEPSGMVILAATVLLGPSAGVLACLVKDAAFLITGMGNLFGVASDFFNTAAFAIVAGMFIRRTPAVKNHLTGYAAGTLAATLVMIPVNYVILRLEFGMSAEVVTGMLLPAILPFNLLKGLLNSTAYHLVGRIAVRILHKQRADGAA